MVPVVGERDSQEITVQVQKSLGTVIGQLKPVSDVSGGDKPLTIPGHGNNFGNLPTQGIAQSATQNMLDMHGDINGDRHIDLREKTVMLARSVPRCQRIPRTRDLTNRRMPQLKKNMMPALQLQP
jgi:hypothetical protein